MPDLSHRGPVPSQSTPGIRAAPSARRLGRRALIRAVVPAAVMTLGVTCPSVLGPSVLGPSVLGPTVRAELPTTAGHTPEASAQARRTILAPALRVRSLTQGDLHRSLADGVRGGSVATAGSTSDIPDAALAAYQRAAQIIDSADSTCHLDWSLLAAIGRVESDHGRTGGGASIYGPRLDGTGHSRAVPDSDGGTIDHDPQWDRAVGPMQLLPSTWRVVQVDADGDGRRNPQDIGDAALGAAVYLCGTGRDLATAQARRDAVYRYNASDVYVRTVLQLARAYDAESLGVASIAEAPPAPSTELTSVAAAPSAPTGQQHPAPHPPRPHPVVFLAATPDPSPAASVPAPASLTTPPPPGEAPEDPAEPAEPAGPAMPAEPAEPAGPAVPGDAAEPADPAVPAEQPACPAGALETTTPASTDSTGEGGNGSEPIGEVCTTTPPPPFPMSPDQDRP